MEANQTPTRTIIFLGNGDLFPASTAYSIFNNLGFSSNIRAVCATFGNEAPGSDTASKTENPNRSIPISDIHRLDLSDLMKSDLIISFDSELYDRWSLLPGTPPILDWSAFTAGFNRDDPLPESWTESMRYELETLFRNDHFLTFSRCESKWIRFAENLDMGIAVHDVDRRFTYFNQYAEEITGFSKEEILGRDCYKLFPWRFCSARCVCCTTDFNRCGKHWFSRQIIRKDGGIRYVEMLANSILDDTGRNRGMLVAFRDQTFRIQVKNNFSRTKHFMGIIGNSRAISDVFEAIQDVGPTDVSVLIEGESGTGKELVAEAIHKISKRAAKPFIAMNCGALPEGLLESELFGHVKGSFSGAIRDKKGRFELADGGTIFLDEVGELSPLTQVRLLRVLENGSFERVGSEKTIKVDFRIISATNRNLEERMKKHLFREDLFYRLCGFPIKIPPLRDRTEDIRLLVEKFLNQTKLQLNRTAIKYTKEFMDALMNYSWPGNVRQLQNVVQLAVIKSHSEYLDVHVLPDEIRTAGQKKRDKNATRGRPRKLRRDEVHAALEKTGGNISRAAELLHVSRATLHRFMRRSPVDSNSYSVTATT